VPRSDASIIVPVALLKGDTRRLRAGVELGCATPEHAAFVARLAKPCDPS
jgi:hypothetical protein